MKDWNEVMARIPAVITLCEEDEGMQNFLIEKGCTYMMWSFGDVYVSGDPDNIDREIDEFFAEYERRNEEQKANAKLIAAAPDMLEALRKIIREKVNRDGVSYELSSDLRNTIEEAIKKATL